MWMNMAQQLKEQRKPELAKNNAYINGTFISSMLICRLLTNLLMN